MDRRKFLGGSVALGGAAVLSAALTEEALAASVINYTLVSVCAGGDHVTLDITFNGTTRRITYLTDEEIRPSLSALTGEERAQLLLLILKVHFSGQTRLQIQTAITAPGGVNVTV